MRALILTLGLVASITYVAALNECDSNPCQNGAACKDGILGYYTCECVGNYEGENCDVAFPTGNICPFGNIYEYVDTAISGVLPDRYSCNSLIRLHGATTVNITFTAFHIEEMKDVVWLYPGLASDSNDPVEYPGYDDASVVAPQTLTFTGEQNFWLEIFTDKTITSNGFTFEISADGDDCLAQPCQNGATCIDLIRDYRCECDIGFEGKNCSIDTDECRSNPCENGGTCGDFTDYYNCTCSASYTGYNCETGVVIVSLTSPTVDDTTFWVREGGTTQSLDFDLEFSPSSLATYSVGGSGTSDLWTIDVFFSSSSTGVPVLVGEQSLTTLTTDQRTATWSPPASTTISGIQAAGVSVPSGATCSDLQYFCARLGRGSTPSPYFELIGDPDAGSLLGCTIVTCRGVEITNTAVTLNSGDILEGSQQTLNLDVSLSSDADAGSVSGSNLLDLVVFFSANADGSGSRYEVTNVATAGFSGISAGVDADLNGLTASVDLIDGPTCSQFGHLCVEVARGSSPSIDYTFSGSTSSSLLGCQPITCRGVEITSSQVAVGSGDFREGASQIVVFDVTLNSDANAGSVTGSNLWQITAFLSTNQDGSNNVFTLATPTLTSSHGSTGVTAGSPSTISAVNVNLDLVGGPTCSEFSYFCVTVDKGSSSNPDFLLSGERTTCEQVTCRGVEVTSTTLAISGGELIEGETSTVNFGVALATDAAGGGVTGTNLWSVTAFLSSNNDGSNRLLTYSVNLPSSAANSGVTAGTNTALSGLSANFMLDATVTCSDAQYICVEVDRGVSSNPAFLLTGSPDANSLIDCESITCGGVEITSTNLQVNSGYLREGYSNSPITFDIELTSNPSAGSVSGSGLWDVTAWLSLSSNGQGTRYLEQAVSLTAQQSGTAIVDGIDTATISGLELGWDTTSGPVCSQASYMCVTVDKGTSSNPDFNVVGFPDNSVFTSCQELTCRDVEITGTTFEIQSGSFLEGTSQQIDFQVTLNSDANGGGVSGSDLWEIIFFLTDSTGTTRQDQQTVLLSNVQANAEINPGTPTVISGLTRTLNLQDGPTCSEFSQVCVTVGKAAGANPNFGLSGVPDDSALLGCTSVTCTGVQVTETALTVTTGDFQEGTTQTVNFNVDITADANGGSVSGSSLWLVTAFGSQNANGNGNRIEPQTVTLDSTQGSTAVTAGSTARLAELGITWDLADGSPACADFDYFCVQVEKSPDSSVDFQLMGQPSDDVLITCTSVTCRGLEISSTVAEVTSSDILEGTQQDVGLRVILDSDSNGGSVTGDGLWQIAAFLSSNSDGSGSRLEETTLTLSSDQAGTDITAGNPAEISGLTYPLNLQGGPTTCSDFNYVCVEIAQGSNPSPSFLLDSQPANLISCDMVSCRGVNILDTTLALTSGDIQEGATNQVTFGVTLSSDGQYGSVSGSNLWDFTIYGSTAADGSGPRVLSQSVSLGSQASTSLSSGVDTDFNSLGVTWGVSGALTCSDVQYICIEVSKNAAASPDFNIKTSSDLSDCQSVTCRGVEVTDTTLSVTLGSTLVERDPAHSITFNLGIDSNADGGSVSGTNLWSVRAYASDSSSPGGSMINPVEVTLDSAQLSTGIAAGTTSTLQSVNANLNLDGVLCADVSGICVELSKNPSANPDYTFEPEPSALVSCVPASCTGVVVTGVTYTLDSGGPIQAGSSSNNLDLNVNILSDADGAGVSGSSLWQVDLFLNDQADGSGMTSHTQLTTIPGATNSQSLIAGSTLTLTDVTTTLDLFGEDCASLPYICIRLSKNSLASPDFTLSNSSSLVYCQTILCEDTNECNPDPCQNGGLCTDLVNDYSCTCDPGYTDRNCQTDINECASMPCLNGATCNDLVNGFTCTCAPGYTGTFCNQDIDECGSQPCQNGGTCNNGLAMYTCDCPAGYTGVNCEMEIDECASNPCQNGGTCQDFVNRFLCECSAGWAGDVCDVDIDECASFPCRNGGTCTHGIDVFYCQCAPGWTGITCDVDIDECLSAPCINGACTHGIDFYFCTCDAGWTGLNCDMDINECESDPCLNGGTCVDNINMFTCTCAPGWTDVNCQADINECASNPCLNGGTCNNLQNEYECDCLPGYTGDNCETNIDECDPSPCENGGTCLDGINEFTCVCTDGWTGATCHIAINECTSLPCQNGGTCNDANNGFTCTCAPGWTGEICTEDIDECESSPCKNGGTCSHGTNVYYCECTSAWTGYNCDIERRECDSNPCKNGGTCNEQLNGYMCNCVAGYTGTNCETDINECSSNPCQNGATCLNEVNQYTCQCAPGYTGDHCQFDIDECQSTPCLNGGFCTDKVNLYVCTCTPGWTGTNCQTDIDECASSPCKNGGQCSHGTNTYTCVCQAGYTGTNCEYDIDECSSSPCQNGATCHNNINQYVCTCRSGFTGNMCEIEIDECESSPCLNGGICNDNIDSYSCFCAEGYAGVNCETDINECASSPCLEGGTCVDEVNGYTCICPSGREGIRCELDTNECANNPCLNGGTCANLDNAFSCTCVAGYTGTTCDTEVNECSSDPCINGGVCTHGIDFFSCACLQGFEGVFCEIDTDECASNPCQNGGVCNDQVNSYTCTCASGWTGINCQTNINDCDPNPCANGFCIDRVDDFSCVCNSGWTGELCDTDIDECASDPCANGGSCTNGVAKYSCTCASGWTGYNCEDDLNECSSNPCFNGATCNNLPNAYSCTCAPGWTGYNCDQDIDECAVGPCLNDGTCVNHLNRYECQCSPAYTGTNCEIQIDECQSNPCQNAGTCNDIVNGYTCSCAAGWQGIHCDTPTNECGSNPCINGLCLDEHNGFRCICSAGWTGEVCNININDCTNSSCLNGGTCIDGVNSFTCVCPPGWTGATCNIDIDECASQPCQNGATCNNLLNMFTCTCATGYTGTYCEIDIDECSSQPCQNGGLCYNVADNSYRCACQPGYTDTNCETNIDECASDPCLNGGTCTDQVNAFVCECASGYVGTTCAGNANECSSNPCQNGGICLDYVDSYVCACPQGYTGANCETDTDECASNPCMNGATCQNRIGEHGYDCICASGFEDTHCQTNIDDCLNSPCLNGGICVDGVNTYTCTCPQGWSGMNCQTSIGCRVNYTLGVGEKVIINSPNYPANYGNGENCLWIITGINGRQVDVDFKDFITENRYDQLKMGVGTVPNIGSERLGSAGSGPVMPGDFINLEANALWLTFQTDNEKTERGFSLEIRDGAYRVLTPCDANPCINGGSCSNVGTTQFQCDCSDLWEGTHCQTPSEYNQCGLYPCGNGAECVNNGNNYTCVCPAGYTGINCLEDVDECANDPCENGGTCMNLVNSYVCVCASCYSGVNCEQAPSTACGVNPCMEDGSEICYYADGSYECTCKDNYAGTYCEYYTDSCDPNPCFSGSCVTVDGDYMCICDEAYIGVRCDILVSEDCTIANPCQNGAGCTYTNATYTCACADGYEGEYCDQNINDCDGVDCSGNGVCEDGVDSFTCVCRSGYTGRLCRENVNECESDPCLNGGACTDGVNGFTCACQSGYLAPLCSAETVAVINNVAKAYTFEGTEISLNPYYIMLIAALGMFAIFFLLLFLIANANGPAKRDQYDAEKARHGEYPSTHRSDMAILAGAEPPARRENDYGIVPPQGPAGGVNEANSYENPWPQSNNELEKTQL